MPTRTKALLADAPLADLSRVGVVDVGSNSVRLVIFDGAARSPAYFFNEKVLCGLGAGLGQSGVLSPEGRVLALSTLARFCDLARRMNVTSLTGVATAAVREAKDGPDFVAQVERETGLTLRVVSGQEEARLAAQGVLVGWPEALGLTVDIGGASMELARIHGGRIGSCVTSSLAPLALADLKPKDVDRTIETTLTDLRDQMPGNVETMFLVGGSWRAIASLHMARTEYPLRVLHAYQIDPADLAETAEWAASRTLDDLSGLTATSDARMALVPMASRVLVRLLDHFTPGKVLISSYGLREGVLYDHMSADARRRDPLIEAARHMELAAARFPGFGDALFEWILPIFPDLDEYWLRLVQAACLLHDVNWRTHPDFRATAGFEAVTRANLGGIGHRGRIFIGLVLSHRYKSGRRARPDEALLTLLTQEEQVLAEVVGRALRLGSMLTGASASCLEDAPLRRKAAVLSLTLKGEMTRMGGAVVEKRLAKLAQALELEATVEVSAP
ncbi:Ppx/GppA family phosphatase [Pontivivens insulae]|uniref:Exopolyphosphatase n=1 Tax=Pontivivens insulae TaxID=1639689 RepID=A0A2R8AFM4_9RHOB|nr:Ppx/GppA family phosphatase [Pontivivens insulae]RED12124.1 Ppx/GppA phosphatase [Pontivivens insulae]SPF30880.1 Exopolyphosphatase [Pontivivens insulae]